MDMETYKALRAAGLSDRDIRQYYTLDDASGRSYRLMGTPELPSGYHTVGYGAPGGMQGRPAWEDVNSTASDELQAEAEAVASAQGKDLADLARHDPELAKRIYAIAEATVQYRGAQPRRDEMVLEEGGIDVDSDDFDPVAAHITPFS